MRDLDPNDLVIFACVVEEGSFKRAAERLRVPNSTVSRRIMVLEEQLGEKLLHRTTRSFALTDLGSSVLPHARQVAAEIDAAAQLVRSGSSEPTGHLRISIPTDFTADMMASLFARFMATYPRLSIDVDVSRRRVDLISENFDLAIRIGDLQDDATLAARRVGTIEMGLYAAPGYLAARGTPDTPADLSGHEFLHLTQTIGHPPELRLTSDEGTWSGGPPGRMTANSPGVLMHMALNGAGIAPLANHLAADKVSSGALVRVLMDWHQSRLPIWAVFPGRRLLPTRTRLFTQALSEELAQ
ncbi:LysR family transcriptional regulator [Aureimonas flava]|uniref:LysR family transcriptional regulator n=1 Tax=Aureimonas flava TaxID=2320271 RepID=A0A3A1WIR4_9HYPH|nr:LysR family transcriptional regulator [Aureimonas flava]RIX98713.1 LysR family transcriptional regulator [Aureimonas flava]